MKSARIQALLLPILCLAAPAAMAEGEATTLKSLNGTAVLTGVLAAADIETFTLETVAGVYVIRRDVVTCTGFCPEGELAGDGAEKVAQSG